MMRIMNIDDLVRENSTPTTLLRPREKPIIWTTVIRLRLRDR